MAFGVGAGFAMALGVNNTVLCEEKIGDSKLTTEQQKQADEEEEFRVELKKRYHHPKQIRLERAPDWAEECSLLAIGTRLMAGRSKASREGAYAFGVYISLPSYYKALKKLPDSERVSLARWETVYAPIRKDTKFERAILGNHFDKAIRITMGKNKDAAHLAGGFWKTIGKRLLPEDKKARKELASLVAHIRSHRQFFKGGDLVFFWEASTDSLLVFTDGYLRFKVADAPKLCWALFSAYLGRRSVAPESKADFEAAWEEFCQTHAIPQ